MIKQIQMNMDIEEVLRMNEESYVRNEQAKNIEKRVREIYVFSISLQRNLKNQNFEKNIFSYD